MGVITFNGIASSTKGIVVEHFPNYETPERDYDVIHVPGKNGDILIDKGSYKNVTRSYDIAIGDRSKNFDEIANDISEWLHSASGYARLEDSYEPLYFRLAMYEESGMIENILNHAGRTTVSFNCKPQRFLKTGEQAKPAGTLTNPTGFTALPIITVRGSGSGVLRVGAYTVTISSISTSIVINSEIQDAYSGSTNRNSDITLSNGFPKLVAGNNVVSYSGGISSVEVVPKWWTL